MDMRGGQIFQRIGPFTDVMEMKIKASCVYVVY